MEHSLQQGDIGVVRAAIDADIDVRSWNSDYRRGEIPFTHERVFYSDDVLFQTVFDEAQKRNIGIFESYISSGSAFLDAKGKKKFVKNVLPELETKIENTSRIPNLYDMECSAVLQVSQINKIPALVLRVVSDTLEGNAAGDFNAFIAQAIDQYVPLVDGLMRRRESILSQ